MTDVLRIAHPQNRPPYGNSRVGICEGNRRQKSSSSWEHLPRSYKMPASLALPSMLRSHNLSITWLGSWYCLDEVKTLLTPSALPSLPMSLNFFLTSSWRWSLKLSRAFLMSLLCKVPALNRAHMLGSSSSGTLLLKRRLKISSKYPWRSPHPSYVKMLVRFWEEREHIFEIFFIFKSIKKSGQAALAF